jgi:hypothetical protein
MGFLQWGSQLRTVELIQPHEEIVTNTWKEITELLKSDREKSV